MVSQHISYTLEFYVIKYLRMNESIKPERHSPSPSADVKNQTIDRE